MEGFSRTRKIEIILKNWYTKDIPRFTQRKKIQKLWKDFLSIYNTLRSIETDSTNLQEVVNQWIKLFLEVYRLLRIYIHFYTIHQSSYLCMEVQLHFHSKVLNAWMTVSLKIILEVPTIKVKH